MSPLPAAVLPLLVLTFPGAFSQEEGREGIAWEKDLETAMAKSKKDGRPVIAYFTFDT